jgi:hypothetical protein
MTSVIIPPSYMHDHQTLIFANCCMITAAAQQIRYLSTASLPCNEPEASQGLAGDCYSEEELMWFVHNVISKFRHWAEDRGGWRVF